jgi:hypothetical protein
MAARHLRHVAHGGVEAWVVELGRDAHEVGQVEVTDPEHVDAVDRCDLLHLVEPAFGLDLCDHQRAFVVAADLVAHVAAEVVALCEAERRTAPARRRITAGLHDRLRLLGRLHHRDHHAARAEVERACNERVLAAGDPDHRLYGQAAATGEQPLQRFEAEASVLHVVEHKTASRIGQDGRHAGREELEHHRTGHRLASQHIGLDRARLHGVTPLAALSVAPSQRPRRWVWTARSMPDRSGLLTVNLRESRRDATRSLSRPADLPAATLPWPRAGGRALLRDFRSQRVATRLIFGWTERLCAAP